MAQSGPYIDPPIIYYIATPPIVYMIATAVVIVECSSVGTVDFFGRLGMRARILIK